MLTKSESELSSRALLVRFAWSLFALAVVLAAGTVGYRFVGHDQ